jgi:hypothetical protein
VNATNHTACKNGLFLAKFGAKMTSSNIPTTTRTSAANQSNFEDCTLQQDTMVSSYQLKNMTISNQFDAE